MKVIILKYFNPSFLLLDEANDKICVFPLAIIDYSIHIYKGSFMLTLVEFMLV